MKRKPALPPLPSVVHTALGPVPVRIVKDLTQKAEQEGDKPDQPGQTLLGRAIYRQRTLEIDADMDLVVQWSTLYHEMAHMALFDVGAAHGLTHAQEEAICDAIAHARMAEMLATVSPRRYRSSPKKPRRGSAR